VFVLGLLPVLGLTPFVFQWLSTVADRYVYLSMLGPAMAIAFVASEIRRPTVRYAIAALLVVLAARSFVQAGVWKDTPTLMRHTLAINPNSPASNNILGDQIFRGGDVASARPHFEHAVNVAPQYLSARDNLASALMLEGRIDDAIALMKQTLALRRGLPAPLRQPIEPDLARLAAAERARHAMRQATTQSGTQTPRP
jgi:Flp pilus assembly protein TadD